MGIDRIPACLFMLIFGISVHAQNGLEDQLEQGGEQIQSQQLEGQTTFPLDINTASRQELLTVPGLGKEAVEAIIKHRKLSPFHSLLELQTLIKDLEWVRSQSSIYLYVSSYSHPVSIQSKHQLILRAQPLMCARSDQVMSGPLMNSYMRLRWGTEHVNYGLAFEQDAGEGYRNLPADHVSAFAEIRGRRGRLILGDYAAHLGQGGGFGSRPSFFQYLKLGSAYRHPQDLRPSATAAEYGYLRGIAGEYVLDGWRFNMGLSHLARDMRWNDQLNRYTLYQDGYHRTASELDRRKTAMESTALLGVRKELGRLKMGVGGAYVRSPTGSRSYRVVLDHHYSHKRGISYSEWSYGPSGTLGRLGYTGSLSRNYGFQVLVEWAHLKSEAEPFIQSAFKENGLRYTLDLERKRKGHYWFLRYTRESKRTPAYLQPIPNNEDALRIHYEPRIRGLKQLYFRFSSSRFIRNSSEFGIQEYIRARLRTHAEWSWTKDLLLKQRLVISRLDKPTVNWGKLYYLELDYRPQWRSTRLGLRYTWYRDIVYLNRTYVYEPNVLYAFSIPGFQGSGTRFSLIARQGWKRWKMELKYSLDHSPERESWGTSPIIIRSSFRHQLTLQLRYSWY